MSAINLISGYFKSPVNLSELKNCPICLEDITTNMVAHAAINSDGSANQTQWHHLHEDCLQQWVSQSGNPAGKIVLCPACKVSCSCNSLPEIKFPYYGALDRERALADIAELTARITEAAANSRRHQHRVN